MNNLNGKHQVIDSEVFIDEFNAVATVTVKFNLMC